MFTPVTTFKGDSFFSHDLLLFVNLADEDFNVPLHNHDFLEIAYVAEGSGFHHIDGQVEKVRKGDLYIIPVGVPHVFRPTAADPARHPLAVYNCVIAPRLLERLDPFVADRALAAFIQSLPLGGPRHYAMQDAEETPDRLFMTLHREFSLPRAGSADILHTSLLQLLIAVYRQAGAGTNAAATADRPASAGHPLPVGADKAPFLRLLMQLDRRREEDFTLAELARASGYSERHLQRLFKRHTGQSFRRYRQARRIGYSCEWLKHTGLKIEEIAEKAGYKDSDSFTSAFKRCMGLAPHEYRKQYRK